MNKLFSILFLAAVTTGFFACKKKDNAPSNSASVMFVNGCAGTTKVDAKAYGTNVQGAEGLLFQKSSGYKYITAGSSVPLSFYLTDIGQELISQSVSLTAGNSYSLFVGGRITRPTLLPTQDDLTAPASNNAKIRIVNLSTDSLNLTASAGTNFATNIGINSNSWFAPVPAGQYDLKAGDPANINTVVSAGVQMLSAGKIYTLIYTGSQSGTGTAAPKLTLLNNN